GAAAAGGGEGAAADREFGGDDDGDAVRGGVHRGAAAFGAGLSGHIGFGARGERPGRGREPEHTRGAGHGRNHAGGRGIAGGPVDGEGGGAAEHRVDPGDRGEDVGGDGGVQPCTGGVCGQHHEVGRE